MRCAELAGYCLTLAACKMPSAICAAIPEPLGGTDAALKRVDTTIAEREAAKDRTAALAEHGEDANHDHEKIVEIRRTVSEK